VSADDETFAGRFRDIYHALIVEAPQPPVTAPRCTVTSRGGGAVRAVLDGAPAPAEVLASLVEALGYRPQDCGEPGWRGFVCRDETLPAVALRDGVIAVDRGGAWQLVVGNLAVNWALSLQTGFLFFHAAAIALAGRGVLLMGGSGRGKTSVALALTARGHAFFSDEIGAVRIADGELVPLPRAAMVRPPEAAGADRPFGPRVLVPMKGDTPAAAVMLDAIVCLRRFAPETRLTPFRPSMEHLGLFTPMACSFVGTGQAERTRALLQVVAGSRCYLLDAATPDQAAELIEKELLG